MDVAVEMVGGEGRETSSYDGPSHWGHLSSIGY